MAKPKYYDPHELRIHLKRFLGRHILFTADVSWIGYTEDMTSRKIVLTNICFLAHPKVVSDHMWLEYEEWSDALEMGDHIQFKAKVIEYKKRNPSTGVRYITDYKLTDFTRVKVISKQQG